MLGILEYTSRFIWVKWVGIDYTGRTGACHHFSYSQNYIFASFLEQLAGEPIRLSPSSEQECKRWASLFRESIPRLRLLTTNNERDIRIGKKYAIVEGADIPQLFSTGMYSVWKVNPAKLQGATAKPLDEEWKWHILEFAKFLDSCCGIVSS